MFEDIGSEFLDEFFDLLGGGIVGDAKSCFEASESAAPHVFDWFGDEFAVRDKDCAVVECPDGG